MWSVRMMVRLNFGMPEIVYSDAEELCESDSLVPSWVDSAHLPQINFGLFRIAGVINARADMVSHVEKSRDERRCEPSLPPQLVVMLIGRAVFFERGGGEVAEDSMDTFGFVWR